MKKGQCQKTLSDFSLQIPTDWLEEDTALQDFCEIYDDWQFIKGRQNCPIIKTIIQQNNEKTRKDITHRSWSGLDIKAMVADI